MPIGGSKRGREGRVPSLGVQILSVSYSFRENLAKSCVSDSPPPGGLAPPPRRNPGSATDALCFICQNVHNRAFNPNLNTNH